MADSSINTGAKITVAARALGRSEIEIAGMVEGLQRSALQKKGITLSAEQAADVVLDRLRKVYALNQEMPEDIDSLQTIANSKLEYGEEGNQNQIQNFGGLDKDGRVKDQDLALAEREKVKDAKDPNVFLRRKLVGVDKLGAKQYDNEEVYVPDGQPIPDEFRDKALLRDYGLRINGRDGNGDEIVVPFREEVAPAGQILRQELGRLQEGVDIYGADAFPGAANVIGRIEDDLRPNISAEASLAREMVQRDRLQQNAEVVEANNWRAQAAANVLGQRFVEGGPGARADQAIENIGRIASIGHAKIGSDFAVSDNPVDMGTAMPGSLPLNLPDQYNSPVTDNRFAGPLQRQEQWLVDNAPGYREGGAFEDFPQIAIGEQLQAAREGIEGINFKGSNVAIGDRGIRNLRDLQVAVDQAVALGQAKGVEFFNFEDGKNVRVANPGINEVLQKAGMNENQRGGLARALFALEAGNRNPANRNDKARFRKGKDRVRGQDMNGRRLVAIENENGQKDYRNVRAPGRVINFGGNMPQLGGGDAKVARAGRAKVDGKEVAGQLQALDGRQGNPGEPLNRQELGQARMPFIGAVEGEELGRAEFLRGRGVNMTPEQRVQEFGPENAAIANRLERERDIILGMERGPVDPANPPAGTIDPYAEARRGQDIEIRDIARKNQAVGNQRELREAAKRMGQPIPVNQGQTVIWDFLNGVSNQNPVQGPEGRLQVPAAVDVAKVRGEGQNKDIIGMPVPSRFSDSINDARSLAQSQNVDAFYGRKSEPVVAQGGMGSGGGNRPTAVAAMPSPDPWQTPPATGAGISQEIAKRTKATSQAALPYGVDTSGAAQGPSRAPQQGPTQGPRRERSIGERASFAANKIKGYATSPRFTRGRRVGYGAGGAVAGLAGLDALIGGESDRREQEAQY